MHNTKRYRESPRLKGEHYLTAGSFNIGIRTRENRRLITNDTVAAICTEALRRACEKYAFTAHAYCLMPDHAHVLVWREGDESVEDFLKHFKQISGYHYKQLTGNHLWQISFYDRILRSDDALESIAAYIWLNPVRAGIVEATLDYPYSGPRGNMLP